jgi:hypothetical protein
MHALQPIAACTCPPVQHHYSGRFCLRICRKLQLEAIYLGVWLDCKLSFQTHIKHFQSKIQYRIGFLFRIKASFTHAAKHTLVKLTILPSLDFGDVIYKIASNTLLNKLVAVYHSTIRFFTKAI